SLEQLPGAEPHIAVSIAGATRASNIFSATEINNKEPLIRPAGDEGTTGGDFMASKAGSSTGEVTEKTSDTAQSVKEKVTDAASTAKQKVSEAGRQATDKIDEKRGPAADALQS